jgi:hypothetical protein
VSATVTKLIPRRPSLDPVVRREKRRYAALRAIGWSDDLCESCRRKIWLRAGEEEAATTEQQWPEDRDSEI